MPNGAELAQQAHLADEAQAVVSQHGQVQDEVVAGTGSFKPSGLHNRRVRGWTKRRNLNSSVNPKNASRSLEG
jgi:hypothetical protein